jgi:hypothetical protein
MDEFDLVLRVIVENTNWNECYFETLWKRLLYEFLKAWVILIAILIVLGPTVSIVLQNFIRSDTTCPKVTCPKPIYICESIDANVLWDYNRDYWECYETRNGNWMLTRKEKWYLLWKLKFALKRVVTWLRKLE